jgi:phosphohistidine phosphatase
MDLILWRHAEAFDLAEGGTDLERMLTPRGEKQAARMAAWLDRQLPEGRARPVQPGPAHRADRAGTRAQIQAAQRTGA